MNPLWKSDYFYFPPVNTDYNSILTGTDLDQVCQELYKNLEDLKKLMRKDIPSLQIHRWTFEIKESEVFQEDFSAIIRKVQKAFGKALVMVEVSPPIVENSQEEILSFATPSISLRFFKNANYTSSSAIAFTKELDISGRVWLGDLDLSIQDRSDREALE